MQLCVLSPESNESSRPATLCYTFIMSDFRSSLVLLIGDLKKITISLFPREMLDLEEEMVSLAPLETPDPPAHLDHQGLEG